MGVDPKKLEFAVVSKKRARRAPYPYVVVDDAGRVREATPSEREFLEEPFDVADGGRPYTKLWYYSRSPDGRLAGFCHRWMIPFWVRIVEQFPAEIADTIPGSECKRDGCSKPCVKLSVLCETHHQEMIERSFDPDR